MLELRNIKNYYLHEHNYPQKLFLTIELDKINFIIFKIEYIFIR